MKFKFLKVLLVILATFTSSAYAGLIEYTFNGEYHDGSTVSGTFLYNDITEDFSTFLLTLNGGNNFSNSTFTYLHLETYRAIVLLDPNDGPAYNDDNVFHIILQNLGNGPGSLWGELSYDSDNVYSDIASCDKDHCPARDNLDVATSTSLTGRYVDVPEPSTLAIFALGMIGLASRRFKKQS